MLFTSYSCLTAFDRISSTMVNSSGDSRYTQVSRKACVKLVSQKSSENYAVCQRLGIQFPYCLTLILQLCHFFFKVLAILAPFSDLALTDKGQGREQCMHSQNLTEYIKTNPSLCPVGQW